MAYINCITWKFDWSDEVRVTNVGTKFWTVDHRDNGRSHTWVRVASTKSKPLAEKVAKMLMKDGNYGVANMAAKDDSIIVPAEGPVRRHYDKIVESRTGPSGQQAS